MRSTWRSLTSPRREKGAGGGERGREGRTSLIPVANHLSTLASRPSMDFISIRFTKHAFELLLMSKVWVCRDPRHIIQKTIFIPRLVPSPSSPTLISPLSHIVFWLASSVPQYQGYLINPVGTLGQTSPRYQKCMNTKILESQSDPDSHLL